MNEIKVSLSEEQLELLIDLVKEKGTDTLNMKLDMESKGVAEISKSIVDYLDATISECANIYKIFLESK